MVNTRDSRDKQTVAHENASPTWPTALWVRQPAPVAHVRYHKNDARRTEPHLVETPSLGEQMFQNTPDAPVPSAIPEEANRLADALSIPTERALALVLKLVEGLAPSVVNEPAALADAFRTFPLSLFSNAIDSFGVEQAVRLIEEHDLSVLARRVQVAEYLSHADTPFLDLTQLAERTRSFIRFLQKRREYIVSTGLPPNEFRPCRWLYRQLGRLYDTKATGSPCPGDEIVPGSDGPPYTWRRWSTSAFGVMSEPVECQYDDANLLSGMEKDDAVRIEGDRRRVFSVKLQLLELLAHAAERRDAGRLWSDALAVLTREFNSEAVEFYLRMDRFYLGLNALDDLGLGAELRRAPGGVTNLLEVVGHFEQEIKIGVLDRARVALDDSLFAVLRQSSFIDGIYCYWRYFKVLARPDRTVLDAALDAAIVRIAAEEAFWHEYRNRVSDAIREQFRVLYPVELDPKLVKLGPLLQQAADLIQTRGDDGKSFLEVLLSHNSTPAMTTTDNVPNGPGDNNTSPPVIKPKRSTERGEARSKILAALTMHHKYGTADSLNTEPIGVNALSRQAEVAGSSVSEFFTEEFKGHRNYRRMCNDQSLLLTALKMLNGEFSPHILDGGKAPEEVRGGKDE